MRLEPKYLPDPMALYTAATATDARIHFSHRMPPEMIIKERDPVRRADTALALAIRLLTEVLWRMTRSGKQARGQSNASGNTGFLRGFLYKPVECIPG